MTNLFEDVDDPFAEELDSFAAGATSHPYNPNLASSKGMLGYGKISKHPTPSTGEQRRANGKRSDFDGHYYLFNDGGDFSQSITPTNGDGNHIGSSNNQNQQAAIIKQSVTAKLASQRGF
jgi:hypothetical protein